MSFFFLQQALIPEHWRCSSGSTSTYCVEVSKVSLSALLESRRRYVAGGITQHIRLYVVKAASCSQVWRRSSSEPVLLSTRGKLNTHSSQIRRAGQDGAAERATCWELEYLLVLVCGCWSDNVLCTKDDFRVLLVHIGIKFFFVVVFFAHFHISFDRCTYYCTCIHF